MRAIWKGNISFALVTIPVSVFSGTRSSTVSFKYLHKPDLSPVSYKRFCEAEGSEVPWGEITRGYEFEKGRFVEVTEEELKQANAELSRTIQIVEFVEESEIAPIYFDKPYYLEPQKGGERAYALMRDALARSGRVGIARVVLKSREHLAAVRPGERMLTLQLLRFAHEIVDARQLNLPEAAEASEQEMKLAHTLIDTMSGTFDASRHKDEYHEQVLAMVQRKVEGVAPAEAGPAPSAPGRLIDLMEVLKKSLQEQGGKSGPVTKERTVAAERPKKKTGTGRKSTTRK